ncbi:MAG: hypothetical protein GY759_20060 [Chloroflexi bacterium]|nr:hypothetical protein [Chloroflexota bacterium]
MIQAKVDDEVRLEIELRPVDEPFNEANLIGDAIIASGQPQTFTLTSVQRLAYQGYHWRARVVGTDGVGPWVSFGDNSDEVDPPHHFAEADFYNLYEPLLAYGPRLIGFESLVRIGSLPLISCGVETRQVSSFDRTGGNQDGGSRRPGLETYFLQGRRCRGCIGSR